MFRLERRQLVASSCGVSLFCFMYTWLLPPPHALWAMPSSQIELEQVPTRTVIGKTQSVTWGEVAPVITKMRANARRHFTDTGVQGGRELTSFFNQTAEGADVLVGEHATT